MPKPNPKGKKEDNSMRKYTLEDFEIKTVMKETIGNWNNNEKCWNINYSDILTFLIQKAGIICKHYASDLFITWNSLENEMKQDGYAGGKYLFGFRESGVDHDVCILTRLNNHGVEGLKNEIKELYEVEVSVKKHKIEMQFGEINLNSI